MLGPATLAGSPSGACPENVPPVFRAHCLEARDGCSGACAAPHAVWVWAPLRLGARLDGGRSLQEGGAEPRNPGAGAADRSGPLPPLRAQRRLRVLTEAAGGLAAQFWGSGALSEGCRGPSPSRLSDRLGTETQRAR